jgi:MFS family permease
MKIEFGDRDSAVGMLVLFAQLGLAFFGGLYAAAGILPEHSQWRIAGALGATLGVMAGYGVAIGFATLLLPLFAAKWAMRYAKTRDPREAMRSGASERVGTVLVMLTAMGTILASSFVTALLLWLAGDAGAFAALWRFALLGGVLAAFVPRAMRAF